MRAGDTGRDLFEERLLDPDELGRLDHVQDLFDLPQEHHLSTKTKQETCATFSLLARDAAVPEVTQARGAVGESVCHVTAGFLTSFCVQVFGQYFSSPLMI